jgi:formate dehydrogenase major subunit
MATVTRQEFFKRTAIGTVGLLTVSELGFDLARASEIKQQLRIAGATEAHSLCPYCAVGCSLIAYTRKKADGSVDLLQIEGDPDSPINEGRLCPKGATSMQLATSVRRVSQPQYRAPGATAWQTTSWEFGRAFSLGKRIEPARTSQCVDDAEVGC